MVRRKLTVNRRLLRARKNRGRLLAHTVAVAMVTCLGLEPKTPTLKV